MEIVQSSVPRYTVTLTEDELIALARYMFYQHDAMLCFNEEPVDKFIAYAATVSTAAFDALNGVRGRKELGPVSLNYFRDAL